MEPLGDRDPRRIGPFLILGRLGAGGMGTVFRGRSPSGRLVAVKTVHEHLAADPEFRERFAREVTAARRVNGFYTAEVVDADASAAVPWMATRFVDGPSLRDRVRGQGPLTAGEVFVLGAGIAEALVCIQEAGLVHRDLKPSNVVLAADGPVVIDFGIAHLAEGVTLTDTGVLLGTFEYISPEQASGGSVTPAADIFSLGGLLHFAAVGAPAFGTGHPWELMHRVNTTEPDLTRIADPDLLALVTRCLDKDPVRRPSPRQIVSACAGRVVLPDGAALPDRAARSPDRAARSPEQPGETDPAGQPRPGLPSRRALLIGAAGTGLLGTVGAVVALRANGDGSGAPRLLRAVPAHTTQVLGVVFAPDGATFAAVEDTHRISLWRTSDGGLARTLTGHSYLVLGVAWSPGGRTLATASQDNTVRIWDAATGATVRVLSGHSDWVTAVAYAPDGKTLASAGRELTLRTWDSASGASPYTVTVGRWIWAVAYAPDSATLAAAGDDRTVQIRAARTGAAVRVLTGHTAGVRSVTYAPDGKTLASVGADGTARIWRAADGSPVRTLTGHSGTVNSVAYVPDGKTLATAGDDGTVRLWSAASGNPAGTFHDHTDAVTGVAFTRDGSRWATSDRGGTVRIRDAAGRTVAVRPPATGSGISLAYAPDGVTIATCGGDRTVRLWDVATGAARRTLRGHTDRVNAVRFAPDGRRVASGSDDGTARVWNIADGRLLTTVRPPPDPIEVGQPAANVYGVGFTPDGRLLISCGIAGVQAWNLATGASVRQLMATAGTLDCLDVADVADGPIVAVGSRFGAVTLWSPVAGTVPAVLEEHVGWVQAVAFGPRAGVLASGGEDRVVRVWDVASGTVRARLVGHVGAVNCAAFVRGADLLVTGGEDGVRIWDVAAGRTVATLNGPDARASGIAVAPDGRTLATIGGDGTLRIWDLTGSWSGIPAATSRTGQ